MKAFSNPSEVAKDELATEVVRSFGELRLGVNGSGMLPAIRPHDELLIRRCRIEQADLGDIVLFIRHSRLFAHRVIWRSGTGLITQGDCTGEPASSVTADELLGKVIRVMRRGNNIRNESKLTLSARRVVSLFCRAAAAVH